MNYKGNNNQCDICADKGCEFCGKQRKDERNFDLCDMYYCGAQFAELVYTKATDEITINPIDRSTIKDIGLLTTKTVFRKNATDCIFFPCNKTYEDILGVDLGLIVASAFIEWNSEIKKKIVAYTSFLHQI